MGKAARKRIKARQREMRNLADTNPSRFMDRWEKLIENRIGHIYDGANRSKAQEIIDLIFLELDSFGLNASKLVYESTAKRLREVKDNVRCAPKSLYKLSDWERVESLVELGSKVPGGTNKL